MNLPTKGEFRRQWGVSKIKRASSHLGSVSIFTYILSRSETLLDERITKRANNKAEYQFRFLVNVKNLTEGLDYIRMWAPVSVFRSTKPNCRNSRIPTL